MKYRGLALCLVTAVAAAILFGGCNSSPASTAVGTATATARAALTETPVPAGTAPPSAIVSTPIIRSTVITVRAVTSIPPSQSPVPPATPTPETVSAQVIELKYAVLERFPTFFFCDPDLYPVAREVSDQEISQRVAQIQKNADEYQAILKHLGLKGVANLSTAQMRSIDGEHKRLNALQLDPSGQGYAFSIRIQDAQNQGTAIEGAIDTNGNITITRRQPANISCPICLTGSTLIDTPRGALPVRDIRVGMPVWTVDRAGVRRQAVVLKTVIRPIPPKSLLMHLVLADGRELYISPGHPTYDGRRIADLTVGDFLDGALILRADRVTSNETATFDILPSGETGAYRANGILLASTLSTGTDAVSK